MLGFCVKCSVRELGLQTVLKFPLCSGLRWCLLHEYQTRLEGIIKQKSIYRFPDVFFRENPADFIESMLN